VDTPWLLAKPYVDVNVTTSMPAQDIAEDSTMARMAVLPMDRVDRAAPKWRSPIAKELFKQGF
jgi:hypothetical protein